MSLLTKNLNTLPVLRALLDEVSVARAATRVGLSQPTVSGILATLRTQFDDPLLVRAGRGMRLTPRAERLRPMVAEACDALDVLFTHEAFDPASIERVVAIAAPDHLAFLLAPSLISLLRHEAPGVRIRFVDVPHDLDDYLRDGRLDLAVCADFGLWPSLRFQRLFDEQMVAAMRSDHPLARRRRVTAADLAKYSELAVTTGTVAEPRRDRTLLGLPGIDAEGRVRVNQFMDGVLLCIDTGLIAPAPIALVDHLSKILPVVGVPIVGGRAFPSGVFWATTNDHDQEQLWLRSLVERAAAAIST